MTAPRALLAVVVLAVVLVSAVGAEPVYTNYEIGAEIGSWFGGTIDVEGFEAEKDGSVLVRLFADMFVAPKFAVGVFLNFSSPELEGVDFTAVEFGMSLKPRLFLNDQFAVKPGINLSYRKITSDYLTDDVQGLGVNLSVELQYHVGNGFVPFADVGFLTQPTGGNEDANVTWAPIGYLTVGVAWGF